MEKAGESASLHREPPAVGIAAVDDQDSFSRSSAFHDQLRVCRYARKAVHSGGAFLVEQAHGSVADLGRVGHAGAAEHEVGSAAATAFRSDIHSASSP
jgi:hypothetical protein